ncbi:MAG: M64 family metallopeptidase [Deltaproteobacteria bacterium]|nr:M64 family metallopeptidase [Deltaproteobacteria bacterium]
MRAVFGATIFAALLALGAPALAQHTLHTLEQNGPADNRIDLVVLGDGYSAAEQDKLVADAESALGYMFDENPYEGYASFFNLYAVATVSSQSGVDHPGEGISKNTFFDCGYDCANTDRLICCDDQTALQVAGDLVPGFDNAIIIVNDSEYGGSGGTISVISREVNSMKVLAHEFGHTFGDLADEYETPYPGFKFNDVYPNVSAKPANWDLLKWTQWVESGTPVPTPDSAKTTDLAPVGAFEGACYAATGRFRPVFNCLMRNVGAHMCAVCSEALVLAFYKSVEPIDEHSPTSLSVSGAAGDTLDFSVTAISPTPDTMTVEWSMNGNKLGDASGETIGLPVECLNPGANTVEAAVRDTTDKVRLDPTNLMKQTVTWTVTRTDGGTAVDCSGLVDTEPDTDTGAGGDASAEGGPTDTEDDGDQRDSSDCGCDATGHRGAGLLSLLSLL